MSFGNLQKRFNSSHPDFELAFRYGSHYHIYMKHKYTKNQVEEAIFRSNNIKTLLIALGMKVNNGNYRSVRGIVESVGLEWPTFDYSNATAQATSFNTIPAEVYFSNGVLRNGRNAKVRLIRDHDFIDQCNDCGLGPIWNDKPITLQLDHIDGDRFNNLIENLQILCPNCHSQTKTYGNTGGTSSHRYNYCQCGVRITKGSKHCRACDSQSRVGKTKIAWPPVEDVVRLVAETNYVQAGKKLGATDNAVRKFIERNS